MFNRYDSRLFKFFHDLQRCVSIVDIVIRQLFAMQLFSRSECIQCRQWLAIERRFLMRILAITQILNFLISHGVALW
ncbi:hypothetical protein D3C71_1380230 [compost metagenome]